MVQVEALRALQALRARSGWESAGAEPSRVVPNRSGLLIIRIHVARARRATGPRRHSTPLYRPAPPATLLSIHTDKSQPAATMPALFTSNDDLFALHRLISTTLQIR